MISHGATPERRGGVTWTCRIQGDCKGADVRLTRCEAAPSDMKISRLPYSGSNSIPLSTLRVWWMSIARVFQLFGTVQRKPANWALELLGREFVRHGLPDRAGGSLRVDDVFAKPEHPLRNAAGRTAEATCRASPSGGMCIPFQEPVRLSLLRPCEQGHYLCESVTGGGVLAKVHPH